MRTTSLIAAALAVFVFESLPPTGTQTSWQVVKIFQIGGQGGRDYLTVDPKRIGSTFRGRPTPW